jgi:sulfatase maturation enzyme AslB (radical SAM superfamily)
MEDLKNIGFYTMSNDRVLNVSETSQMKRCEMIITEYCNFRCPYCRGLKPTIYGLRQKRQLSIQEICRNIDYWCEDIPLENIRFSGGEPTIHPHIREAVSYASKSGIKRVAISTNGSQSMDLYRDLVDRGANDFSISLDACCAEDGDKMAGGVKGAFDKVIHSITELSKLTYVTVGIVLTPDNVQRTIDTIYFADALGVSDIRVIPSAQWNQPIEALGRIDGAILNRHPILKYRVHNFKNGLHVRGLKETDSNRCGLVLDDSVIAGDYHFPCVIYMREQGNPIGKVGSNMRAMRKLWSDNHDCYRDEICRKNCLDVCVDYNNKFRQLAPYRKTAHK